MTREEKVIARAERLLAQARATRERTREQHRREIDRLDRQVKNLDETVRVLKGQKVRRRPKRSAAVQAGPKALGIVRSWIEGGEISQREIVARSYLNDGTVSYALRALMEEGEIVQDGYDGAGSRVFKMARRARKAA